MAEAIYALCATTSTICAILLFAGYRASQAKLLLWGGACFVGLALNNMMLLVDVMLLPAADLSVARSGVALIAMMVLLFGLVWERS